MTITTTQETTTKERRFYHRNGGIQMWPMQAKRIVQDGVAITDDGPKVQFTPCGSHDAGWFITSDPILIEALEKRKDVMNEEQFLDWSRTPEQRLKDAEKLASDKDRTIEEKNRLIRDLEARLASKPQQQRA